jgi:hypothetical protein
VIRAVSDQYIAAIETQEPSLEEIFLTFYGNGNNHNSTTPKTEVEREPAKEVA